MAVITQGAALTALSDMIIASNNAAMMPFGVTKQAADIMNALLKITTDPNIEGIPIRAEKETGSRDVEVAETMVIAQNDNGKAWLTDNSVPRPREWTVSGYLMSLSGFIDAFFRIKPTILAQTQMLDVYAKSRRPVWYKTHDNRFYQCLITQFTYEYNPTVQNAVHVNVTLREFVPLTSNTVAAIEYMQQVAS